MAEGLGNREGQTLIDDKQQFPLSHQSRGMASQWQANGERWKAGQLLAFVRY